MTATRWAVLERLAEAKRTDGGRTTTVAALGAALDADERAIAAHVERLADCELAEIGPDGRVRITITGEELLALDPDGPAIVDPG